MGKPRLIILVRHAQSEGNKKREIHQVVPDHRVKLTDEGWRQAEEAGRRLRHLLKPDDTLQIFTSPYCRTRETTEGILKTLTTQDENEPASAALPFSRSRIKVYEEPRLREQDFGNFQPCSAEMERMWHERADYGHFFYRIPNGESAADAYDRVSGFNESLWRQFGENDFSSVCVLVTHGLMTRIFLMKWYHWSVEYFEDLRNINHCEFVLMSMSPETGKYNLETQLRTWSELKKQKAAEAARNHIADNPVKRNTLSNFLTHSKEIPRVATRQWGGCSKGCNHEHQIYPSRQPQVALAEINIRDATIVRAEPGTNPSIDHVVVGKVLSDPQAEESTISSRLVRPALSERLFSRTSSVFGAGTPHEMSEDEAEYFANCRQAGMPPRLKNGSSRRATPEDIARWSHESGMGQGTQADCLGDEPGPCRSIVDEKSRNNSDAHPSEQAADVRVSLDDLPVAEEHDRSLRGSVY